MIASNSTKRKPSKPYPEYPLFAHVNGQWCRKINGRHYFFGCWDDPHAVTLVLVLRRSKGGGDVFVVIEICNVYQSLLTFLEHWPD